MTGSLLLAFGAVSWLALSSAAGKAEAVFHSCLNRHLESTGSLPVSTDEYQLGFADLNRDGLPDGIALMGAGTEWVGSGGAAMFVFTGEGRSFGYLCMSTLAGAPVLLRDSGEEWLDIVVHSSGGGYSACFRLLVFDGEAYPLNTSLEPETDLLETDMILITGE